MSPPIPLSEGTMTSPRNQDSTPLSTPLPINPNLTFTSKSEAPQIILVFPGSFNPPHTGHLRFFEILHSTLRSFGFHITTSIIIPRSNSALASKFNHRPSSIQFSSHLRTLLWRSVNTLPLFTEIYDQEDPFSLQSKPHHSLNGEPPAKTFREYLQLLKLSAKNQGHDLKVFAAVGPSESMLSNGIKPAFDWVEEVDTLVISNAVRSASWCDGEIALSPHLPRIPGYMDWDGLCIDENGVRAWKAGRGGGDDEGKLPSLLFLETRASNVQVSEDLKRVSSTGVRERLVRVDGREKVGREWVLGWEILRDSEEFRGWIDSLKESEEVDGSDKPKIQTD